MDPNPHNRPLLLIVSGPAGSGKTTLCTRMCDSHANIDRVVTSTTRSPRHGEQEGVDYYFLNVDEFEAKIKAGAFYEYARVHGRLYGTSKSEIQSKLDSKQDVLLNIDVQGAKSFQNSALDDPVLSKILVSVFVAPEDREELRQRLRGRAQDDDAEIERRLKSAEKEISEWSNYDHFIRSGTRDQDFNQLSKIYADEKLRVIET